MGRHTFRIKKVARLRKGLQSRQKQKAYMVNQNVPRKWKPPSVQMRSKFRDWTSAVHNMDNLSTEKGTHDPGHSSGLRLPIA